MTLWGRVYRERKRVLVPLGIALVANLAVLILAVIPLRAALNAAGSRSLDAMRELAEARRAARQATDARASKLQADEQLRHFYTGVLPGSFQEAETTANLWLAQTAEDDGLVFKGSHFDWTPVRDTVLSRASARITLEGSYVDIRRFLRDVETTKEFIIVERVELADPGDQPGMTGRLQVALTVSTYFLTAPAS